MDFGGSRVLGRKESTIVVVDQRTLPLLDRVRHPPYRVAAPLSGVSAGFLRG